MKNSTSAAIAEGASRFELAPPRRFILPAILLLLSEHPSYGYGLAPQLEELQFGQVDRPAIYRALAQLEQDGLVSATDQSPTAGQARRVHAITPEGQRVLRLWMRVIKEEHDRLGQVIRRYQATGTADAVLAEVEGGWAAAFGAGWSPVSPVSSAGHRRLMAVEVEEGALPWRRGEGAEHGGPEERAMARETHPRQTLRLDPDRSAVLIDVRSTAGPISFGTTGVSGSLEAALVNGVLSTEVAAAGSITFDVTALHSGNRLYDAELLRRIDARRYPAVTVKLQQCAAGVPGSRFSLTGEVNFHGVTRAAEGTVHVEALSATRILVTGEQVFDIRDFSLSSPTVLMLRIYPDIRVRLHVEAELEATV
ncbi:MAG TPA: helix-turn-helix transcriptional regulator [Acidimicrobiales bacterium]|jgi:PadR family transcriptional regulator PadR|nr:helix-turn-helix transcriptional regulator [Acidimicrobiales bacterium]